MFGNHLRLGFLRLACASPLLKETFHLLELICASLFNMFLLAIDQNTSPVHVNTPTGPIFSPVHFFLAASFGTVSGMNLFHCLFPVISGIVHRIPTEPFLIFLVGKIIFLLAVTQCVIRFNFIEMILLAFTHFIQLLPCYESLLALTKQMACKAFCKKIPAFSITLLNFPNNSFTDELHYFSLGQFH